MQLSDAQIRTHAQRMPVLQIFDSYFADSMLVNFGGKITTCVLKFTQVDLVKIKKSKYYTMKFSLNKIK